MGNQVYHVEDKIWPIPCCMLCKFVWTPNYIMFKVEWVRDFDHVEDQSSPSPWYLLCKFVWAPNYIMIKFEWVRGLFDHVADQISPSPSCLLCKFLWTHNYIMIKFEWVRDDSWPSKISMILTKILPRGSLRVDWYMKKNICQHWYAPIVMLPWKNSIYTHTFFNPLYTKLHSTFENFSLLFLIVCCMDIGEMKLTCMEVYRSYFVFMEAYYTYYICSNNSSAHLFSS